MNKINDIFLKELKSISIILCFFSSNILVAYFLFNGDVQLHPVLIVILSTFFGVSLASLPYFLVSVIMPFYERVERFFLYLK